MQQIELTQDHRSKLLEMCNKLFPEYQIKYFIDHDIEREAYESDYLEIHYKGKTFNCIHWFEFCIIEIHEKIINFKKRDNILEDLIFITGVKSKDIHPIDYLYEQFKKLKL